MKDLYGSEIPQSEFDKYEADLKEFEAMMKSKEPKKEDYGFSNKMFPDAESEHSYNSAYSEWHMKLFCDAPNKPGYYRANND
jgi:hypothetical protein